MKYSFEICQKSALLLIITILGCQESSQFSIGLNKVHENAIKHIHTQYVDGWENMDKTKIMELIDEEAMIQPNSLTPISGKHNIESFWFPNDSSITTINNFDTEILHIYIMDTLAITTHRSHLDWDYQKGAMKLGMKQEGINTTLYRLQSDSTWKIWRSMWTDYRIEQKNN